MFVLKRTAIWLLMVGCISIIAIGSSSCSTGARGRSTAHIKKHTGFRPGKGKAKAPAKRIKSSKK
ncbi:MAG: hypothetical protein RMJ87_10355 [Cytophagales bacterium]|nr:hypothetical protein [Bernardetiaceae bacterium]MDW8205421.1 hypothetical protein [Cytophagales bacterium]